ncbi:MAG: hypothetical protein AAF184_09140 [Pseudomonadota bacterium]
MPGGSESLADSPVEAQGWKRCADGVGRAEVLAQTQAAIAVLHDFSDAIYDPQQVVSLTAPRDVLPGETPYVLGSASWGEGVWGRGYFTAKIDAPRFAGADDHSAYAKWYRSRNNSTHPLIRDIARRAIAYMRLERRGEAPPGSLEKIAAATDLLLRVQQPDGHYLVYRGLASPGVPSALNWEETAGTIRSTYSTSQATRALLLAYQFHEERGTLTPQLEKRLRQALIRAAQWITQFREKVINRAYLNVRAQAIEALLAAYAVGGNVSFLDQAVDLFNGMKDRQREDGVWALKGAPDELHDSDASYTGIILRALLSLREHLPDDSSDPDHALTVSDLERAIAKTTQHFLAANTGWAKDAPAARVTKDGHVRQYRARRRSTAGYGWQVATQIQRAVVLRVPGVDPEASSDLAHCMLGAMAGGVNNGTLFRETATLMESLASFSASESAAPNAPDRRNGAF